MVYPDWIIQVSEIGGVLALVVLAFAIFFVATLLHQFQRTGRSGAVLATLALGLVGALGAALGITLLVGKAHDDSASGGAAIGWMMMIGYPAFFLAGPFALIAWSAALFAGSKLPPAAGEAGGPRGSAPARRRGRFRNPG